MSPRTRPSKIDLTPAPVQKTVPLQVPPPQGEAVPSGLGTIAPPGKLQEENRDSAITGGTRSLSRRVLGLDVLNADLARRATKSRTRKS